MSVSIKETIFKKIDDPVLLRKLELYLDELEENDYPVNDILL